jgi:type II secretory pathway component PulF
VITLGVIYLLGYKLVPAFTSAARGDHWTGLARAMVDSAGFIQNWFVWIVAFVVAAIVGVIVSLPLWTGYLRSSFDRYPPYSIYRVMQGSSWLISMSALIEAGMRIQTAMEELIKVASPWAKERISATLVGIRSGKNLGDALISTGLGFPDEEIISDIRVYSSKSDFDSALKEIGDSWITESVEKIASLMSIVFGASLMLVGSVIAFTMLGLFSIQTQLQALIAR